MQSVLHPLKATPDQRSYVRCSDRLRGFQWSADRTVDLRRTSQRLKMTRKGYQVQVERRKKADQLERGKVSTAIRRLREKVEDQPASPRYIMTKRGMGYYFSGE